MRKTKRTSKVYWNSSSNVSYANHVVVERHNIEEKEHKKKSTITTKQENESNIYICVCVFAFFSD